MDPSNRLSGNSAQYALFRPNLIATGIDMSPSLHVPLVNVMDVTMHQNPVYGLNNSVCQPGIRGVSSMSVPRASWPDTFHNLQLWQRAAFETRQPASSGIRNLAAATNSAHYNSLQQQHQQHYLHQQLPHYPQQLQQQLCSQQQQHHCYLQQQQQQQQYSAETIGGFGSNMLPSYVEPLSINNRIPPSNVDMSLVLAQAVSVPLANAFLQSMQPQRPETTTTPSQLQQQSMLANQPSAMANPVLNLMQQLLQPGMSAAVAQNTMPTPLTTTSAYHPPSTVPPAVASPAAPCVFSVSTPRAVSANSSQQLVQLPPMDANVAKTLLLQLAHQLQQAGQLQDDDAFQNFIKSVQSPAASTATTTANRVEGIIKLEPSDVSMDESPLNQSFDSKRSSGSVVQKLNKANTSQSATNSKVSSSCSVSESLDNVSSSSSSCSGDVAQLQSDSDYDDNVDEFLLQLKQQATSSKRKVVKRKLQKSDSSSSESSKSRFPMISLSKAAKRRSELPSIGHVGREVPRKTMMSQPFDDQLEDNYHLTDTHHSIESSIHELSRQHKLRNCFVKLTRVNIVSEAMKNAGFSEVVSSTHVNSYVPPTQGPEVSHNNRKNAGFSEVTSSTSVNSHVPPTQEPEVSHNDNGMDSNEMPRPLVIDRKRPSASLNVSIVDNINSARDPKIRAMYMGLKELDWLSLVFVTGKLLLRDGEVVSWCQCAFCPAVGKEPQDIAGHLLSDHVELLFMLNNSSSTHESVLYVHCRHCDFVAVSPEFLWMHFRLYHGVKGILEFDCLKKDDLASDPSVTYVDLDDPVFPGFSFVCFDCGAVIGGCDYDTGAFNLACHVFRHHPNSPNFNGCFVKLLMIQGAQNDSELKVEVTYRQAIYDEEYVLRRCEVFVCMLCRCVMCSSLRALNHALDSHQSRHLLYVCSKCDYQCISDVDMVAHAMLRHPCGSSSESPASLVCSATVVELVADSYVECRRFENRLQSSSAEKFATVGGLLTKVNVIASGRSSAACSSTNSGQPVGRRTAQENSAVRPSPSGQARLSASSGKRSVTSSKDGGAVTDNQPIAAAADPSVMSIRPNAKSNESCEKTRNVESNLHDKNDLNDERCQEAEGSRSSTNSNSGGQLLIEQTHTKSLANESVSPTNAPSPEITSKERRCQELDRCTLQVTLEKLDQVALQIDKNVDRPGKESSRGMAGSMDIDEFESELSLERSAVAGVSVEQQPVEMFTSQPSDDIRVCELLSVSQPSTETCPAVAELHVKSAAVQDVDSLSPAVLANNISLPTQLPGQIIDQSPMETVVRTVGGQCQNLDAVKQQNLPSENVVYSCHRRESYEKTKSNNFEKNIINIVAYASSADADAVTVAMKSKDVNQNVWSSLQLKGSHFADSSVTVDIEPSGLTGAELSVGDGARSGRFCEEQRAIDSASFVSSAAVTVLTEGDTEGSQTYICDDVNDELSACNDGLPAGAVGSVEQSQTVSNQQDARCNELVACVNTASSLVVATVAAAADETGMASERENKERLRMVIGHERKSYMPGQDDDVLLDEKSSNSACDKRDSFAPVADGEICIKKEISCQYNSEASKDSDYGFLFPNDSELHLALSPEEVPATDESAVDVTECSVADLLLLPQTAAYSENLFMPRRIESENAVHSDGEVGEPRGNVQPGVECSDNSVRSCSGINTGVQLATGGVRNIDDTFSAGEEEGIRLAPTYAVTAVNVDIERRVL